jgi:hypothetical protein
MVVGDKDARVLGLLRAALALDRQGRAVFSNSGLSLEQPEIDEAKRVDPL